MICHTLTGLIYTQTIHRTTQIITNLEWREPHIVVGSFTLHFALKLRRKHGKVSASEVFGNKRLDDRYTVWTLAMLPQQCKLKKALQSLQKAFSYGISNLAVKKNIMRQKCWNGSNKHERGRNRRPAMDVFFVVSYGAPYSMDR
jgi:hypothetical protein